MIEFNSPLNDKERINQLNKQNQMLHPDREPREIAGYNKSSRKWFFNENIVDFEPYIKWLKPEQIEYLKGTLETVFTEIDTKVDLIQLKSKYRFSADVYYHYKADKISILYVTDSVDGKKHLKVIISNSKLDTFDLNNKRVILVGKLSIYKAHGEFQFEATELHVLPNEKTKYQKQLDEWQEELNNLGIVPSKNDNSKTLFGYKIKRIGVISSNNEGKGYSDFKSIILDKTNYELLELFTSMTAKNIAEKIYQLSDKENVDCICIVRGGGSKYELIDFNNPVLIKVIHEIGMAKTPILTAIGHTTDISLCDKFATYHTATPTALANYLKSLLWTKKTNKEKEELIQKNHKLENANKNLEYENNRLKNDNEQLAQKNNDLENKNNQLEQEINTLKDKKNQLEDKLQDLNKTKATLKVLRNELELAYSNNKKLQDKLDKSKTGFFSKLLK